MNKFLKYGLLTLGGATLLAAGGAAYIAATFDPNAYKARIIRLVKDKTQRTLTLDGDIKLAFFPGIGADFSHAALSGFNNDKEFAALDSAHVSLALLPLFSRQVVVDEVTVSGLKVTLVKFTNGKTNIDDLIGKDEGKAGNDSTSRPGSKPLKFDIASVRVEKSELTYRDETTAAQYALKDIALKTGRIAGDVPTQIDFSATLQSGQPRLDLATQLKTELSLDLEKKSYRLSGLDLQAKGTMPGINDFAAQVFTAELTGDAQSFKSDALALELDIKQPEQEYKVKLASSVGGDFRSQQFSLPDLIVAVEASGDKLPNKSVSSEMKGGALLDIARQSLQVNLTGGLLQSQVNAKVAVNNFSDPAIRFDINVDQFDADTYLPKKTDAAPTEPPLDLADLRKLNLEGSLRVGVLKVASMKSSQLRLEFKAHKARLDPEPVSSNPLLGGMNRNNLPVRPGRSFR